MGRGGFGALSWREDAPTVRCIEARIEQFTARGRELFAQDSHVAHDLPERLELVQADHSVVISVSA